ncbi:CDP-glycerol glycerophosphotransferase family protein [Clostridioides difficile]|uniref:CDP-glycerol glycerophosphotransferase family protein n=1 Tax=Clostridioides difficile TaxID=1496 RepID=UPI0021C6356B|nr:CDP-glycerol glycerophosphotransferase family protein [Clostridioides difficile]UUV14864.1 CDP-glycerol glycerophosphotransferase family protein [Clostridioides difficile]
MNYNKKNEVLNLIQILIEGIDYIKNNNLSESIVNSSLEAINYMKKYINNSGRSNKNLLNLIDETYVKILRLSMYKNIRLIEDCELIISNLNYLSNIIENSLNKKNKIVFMPYNAKMWNSLESIWKSAVLDEQCDCYVVPIPYYKLIDTPNGITQIYTYEGNDFPEDVPIIHYDDFDLSKEKPDIIYVHNQYDDCNNATMVDSNYFSYNLKQYTNMLVYVAYGILGTYPVSFYLNFYELIASRNFDKVIVQSPAFEIIAECSGINKNQILTMGSPKFDSLIYNLKQNNINKDYESKLKGKIIFLWTTNLMKIPNGKDGVIDEIENVFDIIENSQEYGLIYRPHPLELEYVKSKVPECFNRYKTLLDSISIKNNIILDDSVSYYESFNLSHALITDRSSVLIEYIQTKKPILIYDIDMEHGYYDSRIFDIFSNYVVGEEDMDLIKFMNLVKNNNDYKLNQRLNSLNSVLSNTDGSCGEKIHTNVLEYVLNNHI